MVDIPDSTPSQKFTRRRSNQVGPSSINNLVSFVENLHHPMKLCGGEKLQDHQLLAKLSLGDLIAQEAHYHIYNVWQIGVTE